MEVPRGTTKLQIRFETPALFSTQSIVTGSVAEEELVEKAVIKAYDQEIKATVSIGISTFPKDGKLSAELIDKADWALYRAKKMGRNCICMFGVYE